MSWPQILVEIDFANGPLTALASNTWTDITNYVVSIDFQRGRQNELGRIEAGTASLVLDNSDRRFDPSYSGSPYYPNVVPMRKIRISAVYSAVTYRLWTGHIESWPPTWPGGLDATTTIGCVDAFKFFALKKLNGSHGDDYCNWQIDIQLTAIDWPTADRSLSSAQSQMQAGTFVNTPALQHFQDAVDVESGLFFMRGDGVAVFQNRNYRLTNSLTSQGHFGDIAVAGVLLVPGQSPPPLSSTATTIQLVDATAFAVSGTVLIDTEQITYTSKTTVSLLNCTRGANGTTAAEHTTGAVVTQIGELPFLNARSSYDDTYIWNEARITRTGGTEQVATDTTSQAAYFPRTFVKNLPLISDNDASSLAQWIIGRYAQPYTRFVDVTLDGGSDDLLWPHILGRALSERVTITQHPPSAIQAMSQECYIEAIRMHIEHDIWQATWGLSPAEALTYWVLQDNVYGVLGTTTRLAY